jgi:hypothetical protein
MSEQQDPTGLVELASDSVAPFKQELRERLGVELDERDALAVESALLKAFLRGLAEGGAETTERVLDQGVEPRLLNAFGGPTLKPSELAPPVPDIDPWAARYGR